MTLLELLRPPRRRMDRLPGLDLRTPSLGKVGPRPLAGVILFRRPELLSPESWPTVQTRAGLRATGGRGGDQKKRGS